MIRPDRGKDNMKWCIAVTVIIAAIVILFLPVSFIVRLVALLFSARVRSQIKRHPIVHLFWLLGVVFICCLPYSCHNERQYERGNVRLQTAMWQDDQYVTLSMGSPTMPYNGSPPLLIRMSDGTIINTATSDVSTIESKCAGRSDMSGLPFHDFCYSESAPYGTRWPNGSTRLQDAWRVFHVCSNRIIFIQIYWNDTDKWGKSEIGNPSTGEMYAFPLREATVVSLFGKPDRITEYLRE